MARVSFYELGHIRQIDSTLILQLKHFHGDLRGWETKDETVDFKLVKIEKDKVFFEGLTMEKTSEDSIRVFVVVEQDKNAQELVFKLRTIPTAKLVQYRKGSTDHGFEFFRI